MIFPLRADSHIKSSESFKIFNYNVPSSWILREITERDYGIDCYIEIVNNQNELTGDLISVQLKGSSKIKDQSSYIKESGIKISTSNYWYNFGVPVFLVIVDISQEKIYFLPVKKYIRRHYFNYVNQSNFTYDVPKSQLLAKNDFNLLLVEYSREKFQLQLESCMINLITHQNQFIDYIENNVNLDLFLGVEWEKEIYIKYLYNLFHFLCNYFEIEWNLKSLNEYSKISKEDFGDCYELYERESAIILEAIKTKMPVLLSKVYNFIHEEEEYWYCKNKALFHIAKNFRIYNQ